MKVRLISLIIMLTAVLVLLLTIAWRMGAATPGNAMPFGSVGTTAASTTALSQVTAASTDVATVGTAGTTAPEPTQITHPEPLDTDFVLITDYIPNIRLELRYATENNFTGQVIYDFSEAWLRYGTVKKLMQVADGLEELGLGLVIWDAYRPVYAQQKLWDVCPDPNYVSPPGTGRQTHCRGIAVDITLYDLETGELLEMPSDFDEFSALGDRDYSDCSVAAREGALILEKSMENAGFLPYFGEWWHFSDTEEYPVEEAFVPMGS